MTVGRGIETVEKSVRIAFQSMLAKADRKLADKLRRQGRLEEGMASERRIRLRRYRVKKAT